VSITNDPKYKDITSKIGRTINSQAYDNFNKQMQYNSQQYGVAAQVNILKYKDSTQLVK
jgi:hypothetical protein